MTADARRVVYDCNVHLQALINDAGPAGRCVQAALEGVVELFWSDTVAQEFRQTASDPVLCRKFQQLTPERLDQYIINIERVARVMDIVPAVFTYARDPDDAHYVNLALAARAMLIVSRDKDLLALMDPQTPDGRDFHSRFPSLRVLTPPAFLDHLGEPYKRP